MPSIHDSLLTGYVVDGRNRVLTLHTEPHRGGGEAFIDLVFHGLVAYHLEGGCLRNIVLGLREVRPKDVIGDGVAFLERHRQTGWPGGWNSNTEAPEEFFSRHAVKVFELQCSFGIMGWVAAASVEEREVAPS